MGPDTPIPLHEGVGAHSVNPNLIRQITSSREFSRKYPFGTFHFLVACYQAWGDLQHFHPSHEFLPLLLHIDSSLQSAFTYEKNALDWLEWLGGSDDEASPIYALCRTIASTSPRRLLEWKNQLGDDIEALGFRRHTQCKTNNPMNVGEWDRLQRLLDWLEVITGWRANFADFPNTNVVRLNIARSSCKPTKANFNSIITQEPFSYALISGTETGLNYGFLP